MSKKWVGLLAIPIVLAGTLMIAQAETADEAVEEVKEDIAQPIFYESNQFTQPDETDGESAVQDEIAEPFELMAENEQAALYVDQQTLAIKVLNKETGYVWNSGLDQPENYRLNNTWQQFVQSAVTIDYIDRRGNTKTESILTNSSQVMVTPTENGFSAFILFIGSNIEMTLEVSLTEQGLAISVPADQVDEGERNLLTSMQIYPFLGASANDERNGYMFIPDGPGALIRYGEKSQFATAPFNASFYGDDLSLSSGTSGMNQPLSLPVYGVVHENDGYLAAINSGAEYAVLEAYTPGVSTEFYWLSPTFHYRYSYFQPTSRDMSGVNVFQDERNEFNIELNVSLLENESADYSGMAKAYREQLIESGELADQKDEYKLRLDYLGAEAKSGLLWDSIVPMTTPEDVESHISELKAEEVEDLLVVYSGWSKGGWSKAYPQTFPVEGAIGGEDAMTELKEELETQNIPLYLEYNFTRVLEGAGGYDGSNDIARMANDQLTGFTRGEGADMYFLKPESSVRIAKESADELAEKGFSHMAISETGARLYSDHTEEQPVTRQEAAAQYKQLYSDLSENTAAPAAFRPDPYVWSGVHHYFNIPMYSSNYMMTTDTVPFLQIVLKGFIPYYSEYANFLPNEQQDLLRMAEYGVYPSYLLTEQSPRELSGTPSADLFTSEFDVWKEDIVNKHQLLSAVLKEVEEASIEQHQALAPGVVAVTYSNGQTIFVNYTQEPYDTGTMTIDPESFGISEEWEGA